MVPHLLIRTSTYASFLLSPRQPTAPRQVVLISPQPFKSSALGMREKRHAEDGSAFKIARTYVKLERQLAATDVRAHLASPLLYYTVLHGCQVVVFSGSVCVH